MKPLAVLFIIFAGIGLMIIIAGIAGKWSSPAPSVYRDDIGPVGWTIFVICGLIALAAHFS